MSDPCPYECYAAGVDLGAHRTRCMILVSDGRKWRFGGAGEVPSEGWMKGRIVDRQKVGECVLRAVDIATGVAGVSVESAVFGIGGQRIRGERRAEVTKFGGPESSVTDEVVQELKDRAESIQPGAKEFVGIEWHNPRWGADDMQLSESPIGEELVHRLELLGYWVTVPTSDLIETLAMISARTSIKVESLEFEALAAARAMLGYALDAIDDLDAMVVDIGSQSSGLIILKSTTDGCDVKLASGLLSSCDLFTRDVAYDLGITLEQASYLQKKYGLALAPNNRDGAAAVAAIAGQSEQKTVRLADLGQAMRARASQLVEDIRDSLTDRRYSPPRMPFQGLVFLMGGGARIRGLAAYLTSALGCPVEIGVSMQVEGLPKRLRDSPAWGTVVGLAMTSAERKLNPSGFAWRYALRRRFD